MATWKRQATAGGASASDEGEPHPKAKAKKAQELKSIHEFARECIFKKKLLEKCMGPHHLLIPPPFPSLAEIEH